MINKSKLAAIAFIAAIGLAFPAFAQYGSPCGSSPTLPTRVATSVLFRHRERDPAGGTYAYCDSSDPCCFSSSFSLIEVAIRFAQARQHARQQ